MRRSRIATVVGLLILFARPASGQQLDRVWLEPPRPTSTESDWYPRPIESLEGQIVDFDARQLRMIVKGDEAETQVAARRVLQIEPGKVSQLESEAVRLFDAGEYGQSLGKLPAVLKQRPPVWRQQWLTMMAATAAWKSGRSKIALELVTQLDQRPLPPLVLAHLPIAWKNDRPNPDAISAAKTRLPESSAATQLVAASWLLSSPDRKNALTVLQQLKTAERKDIAALAEVLLWRAATPPQVNEASGAWEKRIDHLPMVLQAGPIETLVDKLQAAGQSKRAKFLQMTNVR
ncbi:MAG: hypothetical protein AB8B91_15310 [Rubripirellula sp.]